MPQNRGRLTPALFVESCAMNDANALDKLDKAILRRLQDNGRETYDVIGEQVGLSPSAVLRRVKRLEDSGVIARYVALVRPEAVGLGLTADLNGRIEKHTERHKREPKERDCQAEAVDHQEPTSLGDILLGSRHGEDRPENWADAGRPTRSEGDTDQERRSETSRFEVVQVNPTLPVHERQLNQTDLVQAQQDQEQPLGGLRTGLYIALRHVDGNNEIGPSVVERKRRTSLCASNGSSAASPPPRYSVPRRPWATGMRVL